jgi:hypothetical protein
MISVIVRFWTNGIAPKGQIKPKYCKSGGKVLVRKNELHGIEEEQEATFYSMEELQSAIETALKKAGVTTVPMSDSSTSRLRGGSSSP